MRITIAIAILALSSGCGFAFENISPDKAPEGELKAKKRLPFVCSISGSETRELATMTNAQVAALRAKGGGQGTVVVAPNDDLVTSFEQALSAAALFDQVKTGEGGGAVDILLTLRKKDNGPDFKQRGGIRFSVAYLVFEIFLPPLLVPWNFIYADVDPPESSIYELICRAPDGKELGRYTATTRFHAEAQGWGPATAGYYKKLTELDREAGLRALIARLVADDGLEARIEKSRARASAPPAPVAPTPAPVAPPAPVPIAPAPAPVAVAPRATGNTFVLVIGVNEYSDAKIPRLRFAEQDARAVYAFFATEEKSPTAEDRVQLLVGKEATRVAVLKAIREHLIKKATHPEDMAILYFAGHGFADGNDTYLAPADAQLAALPETAIPGETLRSYWGQLRAGRKVLLLDACHSGGLEGVRGIGGVTLAPAQGAKDASSLTIASTGPNELSSEDDRLGQGVFTIALLKGLRGEADANGDGRVDGEELSRYLEREVPALAARANGTQTPTSSSTGAPILLTR